jgi:hypothetical protein
LNEFFLITLDNESSDENLQAKNSNLLNNPNSGRNVTGLKYQYSFTDSILLDEISGNNDFKVI